MADDALVDQIATQIAGIESGGKYDATGPVTKRGDRAYGKYQIMGANVPEWTREALGTELTPEAFLADPDAQEKTARFRMGKYLDETGDPRDVASMWHSGVRYQQAIDEGRADQLGTATQDYADRVFGGIGDNANTLPPATKSTFVELPDGSYVDMGPDPTPEMFAQLKTKLSAKFPPAAPAPVEGTATTTTTTSPGINAPAPTATPFADQSIDDAGMNLNLAAGRDANAWQGRYGAALTKPIADALDDVAKAFTEVNPESTGNPLELATWRDALDRSLKLLHPLGVIGEQAGNIIMEAATDAGASPEIGAALALAASLAAGAKTPGISDETTRLGKALGMKGGPGPAMPLQGTATTRAEAAAAETAAGQADAAAGTAARASETAAQDADAMAAQADAAAQQAAPSPGAAARVQAELTPGGAQPIPTGRDVTQALETQLDEIKTPVQGIYDAVLESADAAHKSLDPSNYKGISEQIAGLKAELGPTLSGQPAAVIDDIEQAINKGDRLSYAQLDAYKQQLDTLFPGRIPHGATPKQRLLYDYKWNVRDMMRSMVDGEDREWLEAADTLWRDEIIGKSNPTAIGNLVKLAKKDPNTFVERLFGNGTSDKQANYAKAVMDRLGDTPVATQLREATLARVIDKAMDATTGNLDPAKLLSDIGKFNTTFKDAVVGPKVDAFFKALQGEQAAVGTTAATAKTAERAAKTAERTMRGAESAATKARGAATSAAETAAQPNRLAYMTAKGLEIAGAEIIGRTVGHIPGGGAFALLIPPHYLAKALADSKTANLLIRAVKTGANSPAVPTLISAIRNRDKSVNFLGSDE